ncbi:MAG: ParB/RepB/Spo0J family partition protein [Syntrophaceae bacterium]|nr:ParB/RepB/Spo0J family partition protein [Syntrophaceae bacterium]
MDIIRHDLIFPNPDQPRKVFHPGKLVELAQSIKTSGLMEPIVVVRRDDRFMIVAGERRWRACAIAGLKEIPARIIEADAQKVAELSLLENLQREDLNIIEEAMAYQGLINMGLTQEKIAAKMGIKQPWRIQERLNLLKLAPVFQDYVVKGILTPSQAQEMSRLSEDKQGLVFDRISAGKAETYNELRSLVNAMLCVTEQTSFLTEPTPKQREVNNKYDRMIENIVNFINRCFDREDMTVLAAVLTPAARENIERIDLITWHLNRIKRALLQADSTREVIKQNRLSI